MLTILQLDQRVPSGIIPRLAKDCGLGVQTLHLWNGAVIPELTGPVIILGGIMGADEDDTYPYLSPVKHAVPGWMSRRTPVLGICLGGQILASVTGGTLTRNHRGEHGPIDCSLTPDGGSDPLFAGLKDPFPAFAWHNDSFAPPAAGTLLASTPACPGQAFRIGSIIGLQFHPEVDESIVTSWCAMHPEGDLHLQTYLRHAPQIGPAAETLLSNFLTRSRKK